MEFVLKIKCNQVCGSSQAEIENTCAMQLTH